MDRAALEWRPFFLYDFSSVRVSGVPEGGPYYRRSMDGLGPRGNLASYPAVSVAWLTDSSYTLAEPSEAMGENSGQLQTALGICVTGVSLLEEGASARRAHFPL